MGCNIEYSLTAGLQICSVSGSPIKTRQHNIERRFCSSRTNWNAAEVRVQLVAALRSADAESCMPALLQGACADGAAAVARAVGAAVLKCNAAHSRIAGMYVQPCC